MRLNTDLGGKFRTEDATESIKPTLRLRDVIALTVGIIIGAGIFRTPSLVAGAASSEAVMLAAWVIGGTLSIVGALCYAELASAEPGAGGDYHYLMRAFGPRPAFLYAWSRLAVIQSGSIALLAFIFGDYATALYTLGPYSNAIFAGLVVLAVTLLNCAGIYFGTRAQNWLTIAEVLGLLVIIVAGLLLVPEASPQPVVGGDASFGLMMVFVLLTFGGWNEAVYLSTELRDGRRRMGHAMILGLVVVAVLYLLVNLAYLRALSLGGMAASDAVAADVMDRAFGAGGAALMSAVIMVAALTSANATAITGARTGYALARTFPAFGWLSRWDDKRGTPVNAFIVQGVIALLLVIGGSFSRDGFQSAVEYTAPVFWFFLLLMGIALFILRRRRGGAKPPFAVPLYPLLPAIFCLTSAYLLYASLAYAGLGAMVGAGVVAAGGILLFFLKPRTPEETR